MLKDQFLARVERELQLSRERHPLDDEDHGYNRGLDEAARVLKPLHQAIVELLEQKDEKIQTLQTGNIHMINELQRTRKDITELLVYIHEAISWLETPLGDHPSDVGSAYGALKEALKKHERPK